MEDLVGADATSDWARRTVLVTGASGFIGRHLCGRLLALGAHVVQVSRSQPQEALSSPRSSWLQCDLGDLPALKAACRGVDLVVHLAAAAVRASSADPDALTRANVTSTDNVLEAAGQAPHRPLVLLASTDRVYSPGGPLPRREQDEAIPTDAYALSKRAAEEIALDRFHRGATRGAVLRMSNVYGPHDPHLTRLVPGTLAAIAARQAPRLRGNGQARRDFVYVDDVVRGFVLVAEHGLSRPAFAEVFNVGSSVPISTLELARTALRVAGSEPLGVEMKPTQRAQTTPAGSTAASSPGRWGGELP